MLGRSRSRCSRASTPPRCCAGARSSAPTASASCRTTRSSTSGATSPRAATAGCRRCVFEVGGLRFGVLICEDAWFDEPAELAKAAGAAGAVRHQRLAVSPRQDGRARGAHGACARARSRMPLLYAHLAGAQDEVVFDGASFALDARRARSARAPRCSRKTLALVEVDGERGARRRSLPSPASRRRPGRRWSSACATTSARTAFRASSSACRAASIRRWCWRSPSTRSAPSACARS